MSSQTDSQSPASHTHRRDAKSSAATGASAAGVRALGSQFVAFYFRAPAKDFFRTRVDYLAFARAINPRVQANEAWSWRMSTPGLVTHAVKNYGWGFIPNQILPPMLANVGIGAILYTTYLQTLAILHQPSSQSTQRIYPPPPVKCTLTAGFTAGAVQSVIAAPMDALQVRFRTSDITQGRYRNMWQYGYRKLNEIGVRGVFAGWSLSFLKDSFGYAAFFATFEYVKAQAYYEFVSRYYGHWRFRDPDRNPALKPKIDDFYSGFVIRPHYAIEPTFLMLAGIAASVTQQVIQHPIGLVQSVYCNSLAETDKPFQRGGTKFDVFRGYYGAYGKTYQRCQEYMKQNGGWRRWLYRGFFWSTIKQVPSTSAGLVIFELVRRRFGTDTEAVRIDKDGYDILLT